jgi:hypothetical protein
MVTYDQDEKTTTRRRYRVHTPVPYAELYQLLYLAEADYKRFHGLPDQASELDVHLTVDVGDAEIVVFFDYDGTARKQVKP